MRKLWNELQRINRGEPKLPCFEDNRDLSAREAARVLTEAIVVRGEPDLLAALSAIDQPERDNPSR